LPQTSDHQAANTAISRAVQTARGQWPSDPRELPYFLNEHQLAHLLDRSVRTLERRRHNGTALPHIALGRRVLYPRDAVLEALLKVAAKRTSSA
jgi:hypothetical protein